MVLSKKEVGDKGESLACRYLRAQGYQIIEKNISNKYGEIDILARKGRYLHFVEIRTRVGSFYGSALESINEQKMAKIRKAAQAFLISNTRWQEMIPFFSVVAIDEISNGDLHIEFLPDAFE